MSARQPFVPQQPASNQSDSKTQNTNTNSSTNVTLALKKSQQNPVDLGTNKPLNLSGLIKPRSSRKQQNEQPNRTGPGTPTLKSRGSFDGIQRPLKPAVFSKNQGSIRSRMSNNSTEKNPAQNECLSNAQNLQASPFFPSSNSTPTSGFLTVSSNAAVAFRDPLSFQLNSSASSGEKDTHILALPQSPFGSARTMSTNTSQLRSTLDNIPESIEEGSASPFTNGTRAEERQRTRTSLSDSVDLGEPSSSPPAPSPADGAGATGLGFGVAVSGGDANLGLGISASPHHESGSERTKKRNRVEDEDQEEGAVEGVKYGRAVMKRWRGDSGQIEYIAASHTASNMIPTSTSSSSTKKRHQQSNRHQHYYREPSAQIQDADTEQHDQEYEEINSRSRQQTPASTHSRTSNEQPPVQAQGHGLLILLGTDLDVYVVQHMEEYENEKVKWATCEIEDWVKHADELAAEYASLLDFVKEHMTYVHSHLLLLLLSTAIPVHVLFTHPQYEVQHLRNPQPASK
ncbi:hypothetical protein PILCRDRAFT_380146 [Piloderma croceum F 1598]|uniref:Uncharacterized protein n=1 Tax=Piloderma croceum (strain F 1598) TaxID=765440 RepID=A0A0C3FZ57_PILCF|nr:hypothetical protein PILCRDRAFT_380146 [Piloderma croceum F 1598]